MGFNCIRCREREIWAFESREFPRLCWDCHEKLYGETEYIKEHKKINKKYSGFSIETQN